MENKELVEKLAELQMLSVRYVERHTTLRCTTLRDLDRIIFKNKFVATYINAVENLKDVIKAYCKDSEYLKVAVENLENNIKDSEIKDLKLGKENKQFTELEKELNTIFLVKQLKMQTGLYSIKEVAQKLNLNEETIKKAAQQEKLLNTKKVGKTWLVNYNEVKDYWNKGDDKND